MNELQITRAQCNVPINGKNLTIII